MPSLEQDTEGAGGGGERKRMVGTGMTRVNGGLSILLAVAVRLCALFELTESEEGGGGG